MNAINTITVDAFINAINCRDNGGTRIDVTKVIFYQCKAEGHPVGLAVAAHAARGIMAGVDAD